MKKLALILALPIVFFMLLQAVIAADYSISKVTINGMEAGSEKMALELGTNVQVGVVLKGLSAAKDAKVKAWIAGYEYDDVYAETDVFDIKPNVTYRKELMLELPRDLSVVEGHEYTLHVEVKGRDTYAESKYTVYLEAPRHSVVVQDVLIKPSTMVDAGMAIAVQARLENFGKMKERDIKVEAYFPQFGVSGIAYVDALDAFEGDDASAGSSFIMLAIPSDLPSGDYQLKVKAVYSRGHEEAETARMVYVKGRDSNDVYAEEVARESIVSIAAVKELVFGQPNKIKVVVANLGNEKKEYSIEVMTSGIASVLPEKLTLAPDSSAEFVVSVVPSVEGMQQLVLKIKDGDVVIKEINYNANTVKQEEKKESAESIKELFKGENARYALYALIGVLAVALVIAVAAGTRPRY